jgi:hypothetical protein
MNPRNDFLLLAGKILTIFMQAAVGIGGATIALVLPLFAFLRGDALEGFSDGSGISAADLPFAPTLALLVLLLLALAAMFIFFGRLRAIIATVGSGDPFAPANAERLSMMAWLFLGVQVLMWPATICAHIVADAVRDLNDLDLEVGSGDGFSLTGILMVLILFILARVFRHGAAMREDLEGTV